MTLHGIDVSHWQQGLQLAKTDAQFALFKATDGTSYVDPTCNGFVSQAKKMGIPFGVYHFWQGNAAGEADHFVQAVRGYVGEAILVLDFEGAHATSVSAAKSFLDRVYDKTGVRPLIYMSQSVTNAHDWSSVAKDYGLWVARYGTSSYGPIGAWKSPVMWQYTDAHKTAGYSVDGDYFYGDRATWAAYATGGSSHTDNADTSGADTSGGDTGGEDDDMPGWKNTSYGDDWTLDADGDWVTVPIGKSDSGGKNYSVLNQLAYASGTLHVTLKGLKVGHEVDLRFILVDTKSGQDTTISGEGSVVEAIAGSDNTQIELAFVSNVTAAPAGWTRKLRFQIRAFGGEKVTVTGSHARLLYWKR